MLLQSRYMMALVHSLVMLSMKHKLDIWLQHIPRVDDAIANTLSRFMNEEFWKLTPDADFKMTPSATIAYMQSP